MKKNMPLLVFGLFILITLAFVLCNDKDETRRFTVTDGLRSFTYEMPAKSVASFRWKK